MVKASTIVITGANGSVGSALVKHFAKQKYNVRALVRTPRKYKNSQYVTYLDYDMTAPISDDIFKGADYLVHTAYIAQPSATKDVVTLNVEAAKELLKHSRANKLKRTLFLSSMSAKKDAETAYGKQKYLIEKLFNQNSDSVIRSGLVIGEAGLAKQIITFMRTKHAAPLIGGGKQPLQIIHIDDLVTVIDKVLHTSKKKTWYIGTPRVYTYLEFYQTIRKVLHLRAVFLSVPFFIPLVAIRTINLLHLPIAVTEDNLRGLRALRSYDTAKDLKELGVTLVELEEALRKTFLTK